MVSCAGGFPFLTAGEEAANPQRKMRYMLPRILAGDFLPLPNPVRNLCLWRHISNLHTGCGIHSGPVSWLIRSLLCPDRSAPTALP